MKSLFPVFLSNNKKDKNRKGMIVKVIFIRKCTKCGRGTIDGFHMRHYNGLRFWGAAAGDCLTAPRPCGANPLDDAMILLGGICGNGKSDPAIAYGVCAIGGLNPSSHCGEDIQKAS
jgi:hypothetical protein